MARTLEAQAPARTDTAATAERGSRFTPKRVMLYLVLILIALFFVVPLLWMLSTSLKAENMVFRDRGFIPANPTLENYETILSAGGSTPVVRWMFNSFAVSTIGTISPIAPASSGPESKWYCVAGTSTIGTVFAARVVAMRPRIVSMLQPVCSMS